MNNHVGARAVAAAQHSAIRDGVREIAARVLAEARNLTLAERQFLKDLQRPERYQARWLGRLVQIAARCPADSDAFALTERLGAFIRAERVRPRLTVVEAVHRETSAQAAADIAEVEAAIRQNDIGVLSRAERHLIDHRAAIDDLLVSVQTRRAELVGSALCGAAS